VPEIELSPRKNEKKKNFFFEKKKQKTFAPDSSQPLGWRT
jgi:hypothetical protein